MNREYPPNYDYRNANSEALEILKPVVLSCPHIQNHLQLVAGRMPPQPYLEISFLKNTFKSQGSRLRTADINTFNLCGVSGIKIIDDLVIRVTNTGGATSSESTLSVCTLTNNNFNPVRPIIVPALGAGAFFDITIPRKEKRVLVSVNNGVCVRLTDENQGIKLWNDLGLKAIYTSVLNGRRASNAEINNL